MQQFLQQLVYFVLRQAVFHLEYNLSDIKLLDTRYGRKVRSQDTVVKNLAHVFAYNSRKFFQYLYVAVLYEAPQNGDAALPD